MGQRLGVGLGGLIVLVALVATGFQTLAPLMRNHKALRYQITPFNLAWAGGRVWAGPTTLQPLLPMGRDAQTDPQVYAALNAPPLLVLVVGETARAANFSIGGYARETTPRLSALQRTGELAYFADVRACGTSTQVSVPCLFSHLGQSGHTATRERHENLLDLLLRAGLGVLWLDNQSGCKGVCDRVPHDAVTANAEGPCGDDGCPDEALLWNIDQRLAALPIERRARGVVLVLHQMGSHGPAYAKRAPPAFKHFLPECEQAALQNCDREAVVNAYDNSLRYTDHMLAQTIDWLKQRGGPSLMLYVSDHGESLGENGLYLHGMPYALAPTEQTRVPMAVWVSPAMQRATGLGTGCLNTKGTHRHDEVFHSVLGAMAVRTAVYRPSLDLFARCTDAVALTSR